MRKPTIKDLKQELFVTLDRVDRLQKQLAAMTAERDGLLKQREVLYQAVEDSIRRRRGLRKDYNAALARAERAERACREMMRLVADFRPICSEDVEDLNRIDHTLAATNAALSSAPVADGRIDASELEPTLYVLKSVLIYDKLAGIDSVKQEIARLEALKGAAK